MALPRVAIEKLLRDVVPEQLALSKEAVDWAAESAAEFVRLLGEQANAVAQAGAKKEKYRVSADHVTQALQVMEMTRYREETDAEGRGQQNTAEKKKKQKAACRRAALQGASHEELLAEQNALFREASTKAARQGW